MKTKTKSKGLSVIDLIIILIVAAAVIAVLLLGKGGFGNGGGKSAGISEQQTAPETTSAQDDLVTEEIQYVNITVSGSEYLYQNSKISLDDIIGELSQMPSDTQVKISDDNSSLKAYKNLKESLTQNNIKYIETNVD
ncbi:MAG: hypothetical protein Q4F95_05060 [Oscillospiraceae bacterium]|nr:hypothetical protein [Oscillospiraceae bacterium]